jgi:hypothetical protein
VFSSPPYGGHGLEALLDDVVRGVLGAPDETTEIWSWATDWSAYFEAGREWWGTALWTVERGDGTIVAVLASSTD